MFSFSVLHPLQITLVGRKTCLPWLYVLFLSFYKLTVDHKIIWALRKSISRLLHLLKRYILKEKKEGEKKGPSGDLAGWKRTRRKKGEDEKDKQEQKRGSGGGSKRIIHSLFGEQVCLSEACRAAMATSRSSLHVTHKRSLLNIHRSCQILQHFDPVGWWTPVWVRGSFPNHSAQRDDDLYMCFCVCHGTDHTCLVRLY